MKRRRRRQQFPQPVGRPAVQTVELGDVLNQNQDPDSEPRAGNAARASRVRSSGLYLSQHAGPTMDRPAVPCAAAVCRGDARLCSRARVRDSDGASVRRRLPRVPAASPRLPRLPCPASRFSAGRWRARASTLSSPPTRGSNRNHGSSGGGLVSQAQTPVHAVLYYPASRRGIRVPMPPEKVEEVLRNLSRPKVVSGIRARRDASRDRLP